MSDARPAGDWAEDVDDQPADNYRYDEVGNLTADEQAGVSTIAWTPYGKIDRVTRAAPVAGGATPFVAYLYDAQGNRVRKASGAGAATASTTYYVRDAQGNPLAAGLVAFGAGMLISALVPASEKEARVAQQAVDAAKEHGQPLVDEAKSVGQQVGQDLKESAQASAQQVKASAQDSVETVKAEGQSSAETVKQDATPG